MPVIADWDPELEHTYTHRFMNKWTWEEFVEATIVEHQQGRALGEQRYDVIGDFLEGASLPGGVGITVVAGTVRRSPSNRGLVVVVTTNAFIRRMVDLGARLQPSLAEAFGVVQTREAAYEYIRKARARGEHRHGKPSS
jgi:hypothetical protein